MEGGRPLAPGSLALLYLVLFSTKRLGVEFLRESWRPVVGPFSTVQIAAAAVAFVGIVGLLRLRRDRDYGQP